MAYLNKIMLIGNAGKDPEVRTFDSGNKIATMSLATTKHYTDRNGESQEQTTWHNIVFSGKLADIASNYIKKGDPVYVEGELVSRSYEKDGSTVTVFEVRALAMQLLRQRQESQPQPQRAPSRVVNYRQAPAPQQAIPEQSEGYVEDLPW